MSYRNDYGYTFAELIIAIFISLILIAGSFATYITQNRSFVTQESVSEVNTQSKIAHDLILNDIKGAGFGAPQEMNTDPVNGYTSVITPVDGNAAADAFTIVGGFRMIGTLWPVGIGPGSACPNSVQMGSTQVRIIYSGTDGPNTTDRQYLSIDGIDFVRVQACTLSGGTCDSSAGITFDKALTVDFPLVDTDGDGDCDAGRPVYLVEDATFCVDANSTLRRIRRGAVLPACTGIAASDDEVVAEFVEDFQLAYAVDADGDGQVDDDGSGIVDGPDFVDGSVIADPSTIRAVRVNILARSNRPDLNYDGQGDPPAVIENRNHAQTNDDFRRRWWQAIATMRNK
ncbi:MAG: PilW family protein [Nitrospirae bacterium]|nr:PilW family protein [Nitrospirota bacterium]